METTLGPQGDFLVTIDRAFLCPWGSVLPWRQQDFVEDGRKKRQTMVSDKDEMMQQSGE